MKSKTELKRQVARYIAVKKELKAELERLRKENEKAASEGKRPS